MVAILVQPLLCGADGNVHLRRNVAPTYDTPVIFLACRAARSRACVRRSGRDTGLRSLWQRILRRGRISDVYQPES
jgi:hypothetical protein